MMERRKFLTGILAGGALSTVPVVVLATIPNNTSRVGLALKHLNRRKILVAIHNQLESILISVRYEINDAKTRDWFVEQASDILFHYLTKYPDILDSYKIVCNESINPSEVVDDGEMKATLHLLFVDETSWMTEEISMSTVGIDYEYI